MLHMMFSTSEGDAPAVLVVDDTPTCLYLASSLLENLGCRCLCAGSIAEALRLAQAQRPRFAFIDLLLPEGSGAGLSAELHRLYPGLVTYAVTAGTPAEQGAAGYADGGFAGILSKPVSRAALSRALGLQRQEDPASQRLAQRLETLPAHQRHLFLQLIVRDLDDAQRLISRAATLSDQQQSLHRLLGILSAAAATQEAEQIRDISLSLKQGSILVEDLRKRVLQLMRDVSSRVQDLARRLAN
jgi:CheY-like chemotaxis protein